MSYDKPVPKPGLEDGPFWEATRQRTLQLPHCRSCGHIWFPPYARCPRCLSADREWMTVSGRGEVFAFTIFDRPYLRSFRDEIPYHVALIRLQEGPMLYGDVVDLGDRPIAIGLEVQVVFDAVTDDITLPRFRASGADNGQ
jgi:uncharacterized OB-fold protein